MTTISLELSQLLTALDLGDHVTESMHDTLIEMAEKLEEACRGSVDVPPVECEVKPLFDNNGDGIYLILDNRGKCVYWTSDPQTAGSKAKGFANTTGQPHSTAVVMAPDSGKCHTVVTVTFFHPLPHKWVIYWGNCDEHFRWHCGVAHPAKRSNGWSASPTHPDVLRFDTFDEAQAYIDKHDIKDACPWAFPSRCRSCFHLNRPPLATF